MSKMFRQKLQNTNPFTDGSGDENNPMNYLGNLADAMLVLAVGIMLAVVFAFKVNLADVQADAQRKAEEAERLEEELENIRATKDPDTVEIDGSDLREYGTVYMDSEGNLYVLED